MKNIFYKILFLFFALFLIAGTTYAQELPKTKVNLISENLAIKQGSEFYLALKIKIPKGWHTYHENPGKTGLPTTINWDLPKEISLEQVIFPVPEHIKENTFVIKGYHNRLDLLLKLKISEQFQGELANIKGTLNWAICKEVCIPLSTPISIAIPVKLQIIKDPKYIKIFQKLNSKKAPIEFNPFTLLLIAFIGGIILNIMPCVLPVLGIKIMTMINQKESGFLHGLAFSFGVLISFWIMALLLIMLRKGGELLGWGFQLQSPTVIILLALLFLILAINAFGFFEIGVYFTRFSNLASTKKGLITSFSTGILTTIVATPCSAPFVGTAVGIALTQPSMISILIFTFLALGLAFPLFLFTSIPKLHSFLPKPGPWMIRFKQIMGLLLFATFIWLTWILSLLINIKAIFILIPFFILLSAFLSLYGKYQLLSNKLMRTLILFSILILIISPIFITYNFSKNKLNNIIPSKTIDKSQLNWTPYSKKLILSLEKQGKPYFLNFSAAWCLTCQINNQTTFRSKKVKNYFKKHNIILVKADWTQRDPEITKVLAEFNRSSVPFYIYFDGKNKKALPEILTPGILFRELRIGNLSD